MFFRILVIVTCIVGFIWLSGIFEPHFGAGALDPDALPESTLVANGAMATEDCWPLLDGRSGLLTLSAAKEIRQREWSREANWILDDHRSYLSAALEPYKHAPQACRKGILALVDRYLSNGADINQPFGTRRATVLEHAIFDAAPELVCRLLERGADLRKQVSIRKVDGQRHPVSGMTLVELAEYQAGQQVMPEQGRVWAQIQRFMQTGVCSNNANA